MGLIEWHVDEAKVRERELRRSWPQALARAAAATVVCGLLVGLACWLLGTPFETGAVCGSFMTLMNTIMPRVVVRYEAWQERRRAAPRPRP
jgi:hypothetical protein